MVEKSPAAMCRKIAGIEDGGTIEVWGDGTAMRRLDSKAVPEELLVKLVDADFVRINHVYMDNLAQNNENQDSIRELAYQAVDMGINTITPGVTDAAVLSVLWTLNVDFVQGDFLQPAQKELNYDFSSM